MKYARWTVSDLQIFQLGQVSEGPFFNNPQTVDILHRTTGTQTREHISNYNTAVSGCRQTSAEEAIHTSAAAEKVKD